MSGASSKLKYVSLPNMHHLMEGLTIRVNKCSEVLDHALIGLNAKTSIPDRIVAWNRRGGNANGPLSFSDRGRIIVEMAEWIDHDGRRLLMSHILEGSSGFCVGDFLKLS